MHHLPAGKAKAGPPPEKGETLQKGKSHAKGSAAHVKMNCKIGIKIYFCAITQKHIRWKQKRKHMFDNVKITQIDKSVLIHVDADI